MHFFLLVIRTSVYLFKKKLPRINVSDETILAGSADVVEIEEKRRITKRPVIFCSAYHFDSNVGTSEHCHQ